MPEVSGFVEKVIIVNFKSYEGRHEIGPFQKFTCIIGPNGSGKSNLMDALSFVLGIKAKHLRGNNLSDLVYRKEQESAAQNTRTASVTIAFFKKTGEYLHFSRTIDGKSSHYLYGAPGKEQPVSYDEIVLRLAEVNIHVKARNFLVFQGDVMELARRQGVDLTGMLETISGSEQYREEYEALEKSLELTNERCRLHFQHKREVEQALTVLEKQKAEVERYKELRRQRDELMVELILFKVRVCELEERGESNEKENIQKHANEVSQRLKEGKLALEKAEGSQQSAEVEAESSTAEHYKLKFNLEQLRPEVENCKKNAAHWARQLAQKKDLIKVEDEKVKRMQAALQQCRDDRATAAEEVEKLKKREATAGIQLTENQQKEYDTAIAHTETLNVKKREQLREVEAQLSEMQTQVGQDRSEMQDLEAQTARAMTRLEDLREEKRLLEKDSGASDTTLREKEHKRKMMMEEFAKLTSFYDTLVEERMKLRQELDMANARRERLESSAKQRRLADELRGAFPGGVFGRISELLLPNQKRFDLPLQMALSGYSEAFVVRDTSVAVECIRYLKERRYASETFLMAASIAERLKEGKDEKKIGQLQLLVKASDLRRLATMCVQPNEKFLAKHPQWQEEGRKVIENVVESLLRECVIVDDIEEGKKVAFKEGKKIGLNPRVVTLDGEVIHPDGNMSVQSLGSFGRVEFGAGEELADIQAKEVKLKGVVEDLQVLEIEIDKCKKRQFEASEGLSEADRKNEARQAKLKAIKEQQDRDERLNKERAARIADLKKAIEKANAQVQKETSNRDKLEKDLLKVGKQFFDKLNKELRVADVREAVQERKRLRQEARRMGEQFLDAVRKLDDQALDLESRLSNSGKLLTLKKDNEQYAHDIEAAQKKQKDLEKDLHNLEKDAEASNKRMKSALARREQLEVQIKTEKAENQRLRALEIDMKRKMKGHVERSRFCLNHKCEIFRHCATRQIVVPVVKGTTKEDVEKMLAEAIDRDKLSYADLSRLCGKVKVDYSKLPKDREQQAQRCKLAESKPVEEQYEGMIAEVTKNLSSMSPNMKANQQIQSEGVKLDELKTRSQQSTVECQDLQRRFEAVKERRLSLFMKCFQHVESALNPTYKELTSYDNQEGGSAYLDLDDSEEPYRGGIRYTACPPCKRFFPMELLSGGERSMASMALLFAMHSFQPPPLMILDEVDAPFDSKNTASLVAFCKKLPFQCLVISLKDSFFSHSDAIVGVFKDRESQSSGILTLSLEAPEDDPARKRRRKIEPAEEGDMIHDDMVEVEMA